MAVLKIENFGGEIPRSPARQLPATAAQVNNNLLATATEFRPTQQTGTSVAAAATLGAKTLYRTQRDPSTNLLHASDADGWKTDAGYVDYVKGQLNDDSSERTYLTQYDGSAPPRVFDNSGGNYALGIPRPPKPSVYVTTSPKLTLKDATEWRDKTLIPLFAGYVQQSMVRDGTSRFTPGIENTPITQGSRAGLRVNPSAGIQGADNFTIYPDADGVSPRGVHEPWNMMVFWDKSIAVTEGLANPALNLGSGAVNGVQCYVAGVYVFPSWAKLNKDELRAKLRTIMNPQHPGRTLWTNWEVNWLVDTMGIITDPGNSAVSEQRDIIDNSAREYVRQAYNLYLTRVRPAQGTMSDEDYALVLSDWQIAQGAGVSAMVAAAEKCAAASEAIEKLYNDAFNGFSNILGDWLRANIPLVRTDSNQYGLVNVDDESLKDTRFYVTTYVTEWEEESAPSEPSSQIDLGYNDLVTIKQPEKADMSAVNGMPRTVETDRNITKWRIYRSNSGSQTAAFQFVAERDFGQTSNGVAPVVVTTNTVGFDVVGAGDKNRWRDLVAVWAVYRARGLADVSGSVVDLDKFRDTKDLVIGDTVTQNNHNPDAGYVDGVPQGFHVGVVEYSITKTWNGHAWVPQRVADAGSAGQLVYVDGLSGALLGEVCPTTTWAPPPYRVDTSDTYKDDRILPAKGVNPFLRGMTGMANGVMAGFVDNFVAFCEPYVPYAWPVEYQIPLEFPIVGLCAFGQSLVVGTKANPYIISGADSANMSAIKLNNAQECVSARSMVAAMGGVFYASPDGYCFASQNGVEVATAGLFSREDWQKLVPSSIFAVVHDNVLYFWYSSRNGPGCYGLDMAARKLTRHDHLEATAVFSDVVTDFAYIVSKASIKPLFKMATHNLGTWKSAKATLPANQPLAWIRVLSDFDDSGPVTVKWYGDGVLRHTAVITSNEPKRLPPGRYLEHEIEVVSQQRITQVMLASTSEELRGV